MTDFTSMSEEETALIVAMQSGFEPRAGDVLAKALEARGAVQEGGSDSHAWSLTESGAAYRRPSSA